jgi:hypothetical protein
VDILYFLLFVDWKSAFDCVDHDLLLKRLQQINVSPKTLRIIEIFLFTSNFSIDEKTAYAIQKGCPQ